MGNLFSQSSHNYFSFVHNVKFRVQLKYTKKNLNKMRLCFYSIHSVVKMTTLYFFLKL